MQLYQVRHTGIDAHYGPVYSRDPWPDGREPAEKAVDVIEVEFPQPMFPAEAGDPEINLIYNARGYAFYARTTVDGLIVELVDPMTRHVACRAKVLNRHELPLDRSKEE